MTRNILHSLNENENMLQEVKKDNFGSGLLLERDGHIFDGKDTIKQINEDIQNGHKFVCPDHFVVSAVFQKFGIKNANGRIYPEAILKREVEKYITERVNNRCAFGALDHPNYTTLSGHDVTHNILSLEWQGHTLIGEMELHLSPGYKQYGVCSTSGDMVANMLLSNYLVGVSSRGVGTVLQKPGNILMVDDDFDLIGWDVVLEPSTPGANIGKNREELQMYVENNINKSNQNNINENTTLVNNLLNIWG